jgi:DNA-binding XRE family transcriptional regulator
LNLEKSLQFSAEVIASLKSMRQARGISQGKLAEMAGLSRTAITMMESGQRNPTLFVCHALAAALNVPLSQIVLGVEKRARRRPAEKNARQES